MPTPRTDYDFDVITGPSTRLPPPQPPAPPPAGSPRGGGDGATIAEPARAPRRG